jgi:hypothetical protein
MMIGDEVDAYMIPSLETALALQELERCRPDRLRSTRRTSGAPPRAGGATRNLCDTFEPLKTIERPPPAPGDSAGAGRAAARDRPACPKRSQGRRAAPRRAALVAFAPLITRASDLRAPTTRRMSESVEPTAQASVDRDVILTLPVSAASARAVAVRSARGDGRRSVPKPPGSPTASSGDRLRHCRPLPPGCRRVAGARTYDFRMTLPPPRRRPDRLPHDRRRGASHAQGRDRSGTGAAGGGRRGERAGGSRQVAPLLRRRL